MDPANYGGIQGKLPKNVEETEPMERNDVDENGDVDDDMVNRFMKMTCFSRVIKISGEISFLSK